VERHATVRGRLRGLLPERAGRRRSPRQAGHQRVDSRGGRDVGHHLPRRLRPGRHPCG